MIRFCCPCHFGLESVLSFEIKKLGGENLAVTDGRVSFDGELSMLPRANIFLYTAERVLIELGSFRAESFEELFQGTLSLPWEEYIPRDGRFWVAKAASVKSRLFSPSDIQSIMKKAMVERMKQKYGLSLFPETGSSYPVRVFLYKDQVTVGIDTSGDSLHKRGYRRNAMEAPLRETLAATIADLGRVRRDSVVEDPFCGSGTLVIEAAQKALNMAPGLQRRFAAERYSFVPPEVWAAQRQKALAEIRQDAAFEGFGYDIDPAAVELARANARLAGVDKRCHFEVADVKDFVPRSEAIVLTNPPYGERMSTIDGAARLARTFGRQMEAHPCAGVYVITADMEFEAHYGRRAAKRRKMYNGMIPCQVYMYYDAPSAGKAKPMPALSPDGFDGRRGHSRPKNASRPGEKPSRSDK